MPEFYRDGTPREPLPYTDRDVIEAMQDENDRLRASVANIRQTCEDRGIALERAEAEVAALRESVRRLHALLDALPEATDVE